MIPEKELIKAMEASKGMTIEQRNTYFQLLAAAAIGFLRGSLGKETINGFLLAAMSDDNVVRIKDFEDRSIN